MARTRTIEPKAVRCLGSLKGRNPVKYIENGGVLELTARNITTLLAKLDDHLSARTLIAPEGLMVRAVEDAAVRGSEAAVLAAGSEGVVALTRDELHQLATPGSTLVIAGYRVQSVPDDAHYRDRAPGEVYMPESGTVW